MIRLDEKGFVFIDVVSRPFYVRIYGEKGKPWLFYWHPDKRWVTLREVNQRDIVNFWPRRISAKEAQIYHDLSDCKNNWTKKCELLRRRARKVKSDDKTQKTDSTAQDA